MDVHNSALWAAAAAVGPPYWGRAPPYGVPPGGGGYGYYPTDGSARGRRHNGGGFGGRAGGGGPGSGAGSAPAGGRWLSAGGGGGLGGGGRGGGYGPSAGRGAGFGRHYYHNVHAAQMQRGEFEAGAYHSSVGSANSAAVQQQQGALPGFPPPQNQQQQAQKYEFDVERALEELKLEEERESAAGAKASTSEPGVDDTGVNASAAMGTMHPGQWPPVRNPLRTTLMMKNIPNKYHRQMILDLINRQEELRNTFDFLYLPLDFKNRANLGYAFINFVHAYHAIRFYQIFHLRKWEEFNSKKVCEVCYARVQGFHRLTEHFKRARFPAEAAQSSEFLPLMFVVDENAETESEEPSNPDAPKPSGATHDDDAGADDDAAFASEAGALADPAAVTERPPMPASVPPVVKRVARVAPVQTSGGRGVAHPRVTPTPASAASAAAAVAAAAAATAQPLPPPAPVPDTPKLAGQPANLATGNATPAPPGA